LRSKKALALLKWVALVLGAGWLSLLAIEIVLKEGQRIVDDGFPDGLFVRDPTQGYRFASNARFSVHRATRFHISTNAQGYRDEEWAGTSSEARKKILMVGSSALFGFGVEAEDRFSERIEYHLSGRYDALNAGVYGYGLPQALSAIEAECSKQKASTVLYFHEYKMTRWDFLLPDARTVVNGKLVTRYTDFGKTKLDDTAVERVAARENAHAVEMTPAAYAVDTLQLRTIRRWLWRHGWHPVQLREAILGIAALPDEYVVPKYMTTSISNEFPGTGPRTAAGYVTRMKAAADRCGADFAVVLLPGPWEHRYRQDEPATRALLSEIGDKVRIIDLRKDDPDRATLQIDGTDYFDPQAIDRFSRRLARALADESLQ